MTMWRSGARRTRAVLGSLFLVLLMAASAGAVAAAPPAQVTASPANLSFGDVFVNEVAVQTVTVTTARKAVVLDVSTLNGTFTDALTGSCFVDWGYQVPANTTCTIDVAFAPLVAGSVTTDLVIDACMKWHPDLNNATLLACDRVRDTATVSLDGNGVNPP